MMAFAAFSLVAVILDLGDGLGVWNYNERYVL